MISCAHRAVLSLSSCFISYEELEHLQSLGIATLALDPEDSRSGEARSTSQFDDRFPI